MYFITGANGLVGCYLVAELFKTKQEVICGVRSEKARLQLLQDVAVLVNKPIQEIESKLTFKFGDILDYIYLEDNLNEQMFVIHTAAKVSFDPKDKEALFETNIEGTQNVVNACIAKQVKKLCFISSVAAIGRTGSEEPITEKTEWQESNKNSTYAISKHYAELEVWRGQEEGLDTVIVNPTVVLGYTSLGNSSSSIFHNIKKGFAFSSNGVNGFVGAQDVANAAIGLVNSDVTNERFVLCSENRSFKSLFSEIAKGLGKKEPQINVKNWMKWLVLPIAKMYSVLSRKAPFVTKEVFETSLSVNKYSSQKIENLFGFSFTPVAQVVDVVTRLMS